MTYNPFLEQLYENKQFGTSAIKDKTLSVFNKTRVGYALEWTFAANSDTLSIEDNKVTANSFDVYAVRVSDSSGNEALGFVAPAAPTAAVSINTAALSKTDSWYLSVIVQKGRGSALEYSYQTNQLELEGSKASLAGTINEFWAVGTLNIQVSTTVNGVAVLAKKTVADAATETLAAIAVGDVVEVTTYLQNTGLYPLDVYTVTIADDFTAGAGKSGFVPLTLAPTGENDQWKFVITGAAAATYSVDFTVTNNTTNVSYVITVEVTAA